MFYVKRKTIEQKKIILRKNNEVSDVPLPKQTHVSFNLRKMMSSQKKNSSSVNYLKRVVVWCIVLKLGSDRPVGPVTGG